MKNLHIFCLLSLLTYVAFAGTKPLDLLFAISRIIPEGSVCTTKDGRRGICGHKDTCEQLNSTGSFIPGNCQTEEAAGKTIICCTGLLDIAKISGSKKHKRETTPPPPRQDIPNLRVKGCGIRGSLNDFIVGGRQADFWPWMASIFVKPNGARTSRFSCGGVVLNKRYILSAAHCFGQKGRTIPARLVSVRVGALKHSEGTSFPVSQVIVHENYQNNLHYDDIALLKTSKDIEVKNVVPVCLPSPGMYNANFFQRQATVLGWGDVSYGGVASEVLMEATLPVIPNKKCDSRYKRLAPLSLPRGIIDTQLCAGSENGSTDACQGDSGGPLLLEDQSDKWNVVGIVSFGYRCGEPEYPGVYTRVAKYLKWIQNHTDIRVRPTA